MDSKREARLRRLIEQRIDAAFQGLSEDEALAFARKVSKTFPPESDAALMLRILVGERKIQ